GIRDGHVTGVQTCALPILISALNSFGDGLPGFEAVQGGNQRQRATGLVKLESFRNERSHDRASTMPHMIPAPGTFAAGVAIFLRSEERRVGRVGIAGCGWG